jgi:hypothetical protein
LDIDNKIESHFIGTNLSLIGNGKNNRRAIDIHNDNFYCAAKKLLLLIPITHLI